MFNVTGDSISGYTITLSKGDTGAIRFTANAKYRETEEPYTFGVNDRAVFSIKDGNGTVVKEKVSELVNNQFTVLFRNPDTDILTPGSNYTWDVRYVINAYFDGQGRIVDGDQVLTPRTPMGMSLLNVVGDI